MNETQTEPPGCGIDAGKLIDFKPMADMYLFSFSQDSVRERRKKNTTASFFAPQHSSQNAKSKTFFSDCRDLRHGTRA